MLDSTPATARQKVVLTYLLACNRITAPVEDRQMTMGHCGRLIRILKKEVPHRHTLVRDVRSRGVSSGNSGKCNQKVKEGQQLCLDMFGT